MKTCALPVPLIYGLIYLTMHRGTGNTTVREIGAVLDIEHTGLIPGTPESSGANTSGRTMLTGCSTLNA